MSANSTVSAQRVRVSFCLLLPLPILFFESQQIFRDRAASAIKVLQRYILRRVRNVMHDAIAQLLLSSAEVRQQLGPSLRREQGFRLVRVFEEKWPAQRLVGVAVLAARHFVYLLPVPLILF